MSKGSINWIGEKRQGAVSTTGAFRELERVSDIESVRQRLAAGNGNSGKSLMAFGWKAFAAAFVVLMLASQLVPLHSGVHVVMEASRPADPISTSSH